MPISNETIDDFAKQALKAIIDITDKLKNVDLFLRSPCAASIINQINDFANETWTRAAPFEAFLDTLKSLFDQYAGLSVSQFVRNWGGRAFSFGLDFIICCIIKESFSLENLGEVVGARAGIWIGTKIGGIIGAAIFTYFFGPAGTVIGGIIGEGVGGFLGGFVGSKFGEYIAPKLIEFFHDPNKVVKDVTNDVIEAVQKANETVKNVASSVKSFFQFAFSWF